MWFTIFFAIAIPFNIPYNTSTENTRCGTTFIEADSLRINKIIINLYNNDWRHDLQRF